MFDVSQFWCEDVCSKTYVCNYIRCLLHAALCVGRAARGGAKGSSKGSVWRLRWDTG